MPNGKLEMISANGGAVGGQFASMAARVARAEESECEGREEIVVRKGRKRSTLNFQRPTFNGRSVAPRFQVVGGALRRPS